MSGKANRSVVGTQTLIYFLQTARRNAINQSIRDESAMICRKIAYVSGGVAAAIFLAGCDRLKEFEAVKSELASARIEVADVKSQLVTIKARLANLETLSAKPTAGREAQAPSELRVDLLKTIIEKCVEVVHSNAPADDANTKFFSDFDAFYNVASGRVQDNNRFVGGMPAKYLFQKCMSKNGFPLN